MNSEILFYKHNLGWQLDDLLNDEQLQSIIEPSWPVVVATMSSLTPGADEQCLQEYLAGKSRARPSLLRNGTSHSTLSYIAHKLNLHGPVFNVYAACASSLYAFYTASMISLEQNKPVVVFCGDNMNRDYPIWHFSSYGACDQQTGRPFDNTSKGFRMGAGSALYIIKHPSVKSKLAPQAHMHGFGFYTQPDLVANPGSIQTIIDNLSHLNYKNIDMWNAHATGTPVGDKAEYQYFSQVCQQDIPIVSFKGYVGHCMAGAGAIEIAMALDCKQSNRLLPNNITGNKTVDDPRIITEPTSFTYKNMFKASLGFGGKTIVCTIDFC